MTPINFSALLLRLRLALAAFGPVACGAVLLALAGAAALAWLAPQRALRAQQHQVALRVAAMPAAAFKPAPVTANENLALFYASLGEQRYAEQQVGTLFGLAAKSGLTLAQGEYKGGYDANARLHTYQVTLPVKGSYQAVWQFGLLSLRAIPFASLDEISFKRDSIGVPAVEARLRLTMYLADQPPGAAR
jgi:hypothetical protein